MADPRVLMVDDNEEFLEATSARLELRDFEVATATSGDSAVKLARERHFDVAILGLLPQWALAVGMTCAVFVVLDYHHFRREPPTSMKEDLREYVPLGVQGKINILFMAGVIGSVLLSKPLAHAGETLGFPFLRELIMAVMLILSVKTGPAAPRRANDFSWEPIQEVAIIFAGIFAAMIPALAILHAKGGELGLTQPWHYFWITGLLSSFLDNAPTYLTFTSTAQGYLVLDSMQALTSPEVNPLVGISPAAFLAAISCGAVFMGANSYIGNAPNFMVKSIAEGQGIPMPSFFGYMGYSFLVLVPIFLVVTLVFFR